MNITNTKIQFNNRIISSSLLTLIVFAILSVCNTTPVLAQDFTITSFHSDIIINENSDIEITETIDVTFHKSRRGIYREIPFRYRNDIGETIQMPITVHSVTDHNGTKWRSKVSRKGNVINIRIGDPNVYLSGNQTYIIKYKVQNALGYFDDHDELYWNITGNQWRAVIEQASARITLGTDKKTTEILTSCYTGSYGSNSTNCNIDEFDNGALFITTEPLNFWNGFTAVLGWDKGLIDRPSAFQLFMTNYNIAKNWIFILPLFVLLYMFRHWRQKGRDPEVESAVAVQYEPPKIDGRPLTAAETGTLIDERIDQRDLTASIIGLATKGYIELRETTDEGLISLFDKKDFDIALLKSADNNLTAFESGLLNDLFAGGLTLISMSKLKNDFYVKVVSLKKVLFDQLVNMRFFAVRPSSVKAKYFGLGIGLAALASVILAAITPMAPIKGIIVGIICGFAVIIFANIMPAKTKLGVLTKNKVLGFREFMMRADKDRIERLGESLYYEYLPYAIALDVVDNWTNSFSEILSQPPKWFVGHAMHTHFSPRIFSESINTATSHLGSTMFSAPRGSGVSGGSGGGGGFSGGGGGGGGGGSW